MWTERRDSLPSVVAWRCGFAFANGACYGNNACTCLPQMRCPAGTLSLAGSDSCTNCSAGRYSNTSGASSCSPCPSTTPHSRQGAASCVACTVPGECTDGSFGRVLQSVAPACTGNLSTWSLWVDAQGVERNHSCLKYFTSPPITGFTDAAAACTAVSPLAHMVSTRQVRSTERAVLHACVCECSCVRVVSRPCCSSVFIATCHSSMS